MLRPPTTQMSRVQSQRTLIWRPNDKKNGGLRQGPRLVAMYCKFDQWFWASILTKTGHFHKEERSVTHVTAPDIANFKSTVPKDIYMKDQWQENGVFFVGTTFSRNVLQIWPVILSLNFDQNWAFPQGSEVCNACYGPRQRKFPVYRPKGHLYEGPVTRKMEVWCRDHVKSHCTANLTSDFQLQFWPKTGHFPKEERSVTHVTAPDNANVTCTVPKDTYMKAQWQENWRFVSGTTFSRTVLQIWPVILSINFDQNWAFPQGSEVRNACYGPQQRKCHVYSPEGHLYESPVTRNMEVWGRDHV